MPHEHWITRVCSVEPSIDPALLRRIDALTSALPPALVEQHILRMRSRTHYLRDFSPAQIANHIRLLNDLGQEALVTVAVRDGDEPESFEIDVCGADVRGASAVLTGCLAELGMSIVQLEVLSWDDDHQPAAGGDGAPSAPHETVPLSGRYFIVLRAVNDQQATTAEALEKHLRQRLKAAYWHLVRGDLQKARLEIDPRDELIGQVIDSRFRVERALGDGGMGRIYLATQMELDRPVALKMLRRDLTRDAVFTANFQRESRLMAQVRSPDVAQVYAAGIHDGQAWIAMEYLSGGDVAHWLARHGTPPMTRAARWLDQALSGLEYIHHAVGIVHCDIKPANFLLDAGQNLKIGDLGLSQLQYLTRMMGTDGKITGTLWYMSPEQARGQPTDERSDLFSLGASFYHILTGRPPFDGASSAEILTKVLRSECPALSDAAPHIPAGLAMIIERMMQSDPLCRYQDPAVARADLESYVSRNRISDEPGVSLFAPGSGSQFSEDSALTAAGEPTAHHAPV